MIDCIRIRLDEGAKVPSRAYKADAGLDLYAVDGQTLAPFSAGNFETGVHIEIPAGYYGRLESKSGLNINHRIICPGGIIDSGYSGAIVVALYNLSHKYYRIEKGEKLCQLLILPCETPDVEIVDSIKSGERASNGFGSTGK